MALLSHGKFNENFVRRLASQVQTYRAHIELLTLRAATDRVLAATHAGYLNGTVTELAHGSTSHMRHATALYVNYVTTNG